MTISGTALEIADPIKHHCTYHTGQTFTGSGSYSSNAAPGTSVTLLLWGASPPQLSTATSKLPSASVPCPLFNHVKVLAFRDSSSNRSVLSSEVFLIPTSLLTTQGFLSRAQKIRKKCNVPYVDRAFLLLSILQGCK